jgi:hypothetical protein
MKHILNDLSNEEKQRILEQHTGGKTIYTSKFKMLLESKLGDTKPLVMEQTYAKGTDVSFVANKTHRIQATDTTGCQGTLIELVEVDPKTKKTFGDTLYYYVTRNGAIGINNNEDFRVSDVNKNTQGTPVTNYNTKKTLGAIAKTAMVGSGCK